MAMCNDVKQLFFSNPLNRMITRGASTGTKQDTLKATVQRWTETELRVFFNQMDKLGDETPLLWMESTFVSK